MNPLLNMLVSPLLTILLVLMGVAVAWGKLNRGQEAIAERLLAAQKDIEKKIEILSGELREIPKTYVRTDVDLMRSLLMDERINTINLILTEIRNELKEIRHVAHP